MTTYYIKYLGTAFLNGTDRSQVGADNANQTGVDRLAKFIYAVGIGQNGRDPVAGACKLQWRVSGGTFADLAATGAMKYTTATILTNDAALTEANHRVEATGMTWQNGYECEDGAAPSIDLGNDYYSELQFGIDPADATDGATYEFQLWDVTRGQVVVAESGSMLTVTMKPAPAPNISETITFGEEPTPKFGDVQASPAESINFQEALVVDIPAGPVAPVDVSVEETINFAEGRTSVRTTFQEYPGGAPADWTEEWNPTNGTIDIQSESDNNFLRVDAAGAAASYTVSWNDVGDIADCEVLAKVRASHSYTIGPCLMVRGQSAPPTGSCYRVYLENDGSDYLFISKIVSGTSSNLGGGYAITYTPGDWWWIRFSVRGNQVRARAWKDGDAEPATWQVSATDNDVTGTGYVGIYCYASDPTDVDYFSVATYGDAPKPEEAENGLDVLVGALNALTPLTVADLYYETFDKYGTDASSGYDVTPTSGPIVSGGASFDPNYKTSLPAGFGAETARVLTTAATENAYIMKDVGSAYTKTFITANYVCKAHNLTTVNQKCRILAGSNAAGTAQWILYIEHDGTDVHLYLRAYYDGSSHYFSSLLPITIDQRYCIQIKWDTVDDKWSWVINGVVQPNDQDAVDPITVEGSLTGTIEFQRIFIGPAGSDEVSHEFLIDHVGVSSTQWIGDPVQNRPVDDLKFAEDISITFEAGAGDVNVPITETISFQESTDGKIGDLKPSIAETISFQEALTREIGAVQPSLYETLGFSEATEGKVGDLKPEVVETLSFQEQIDRNVGDLQLQPAEGISFQDLPTVEIGAVRVELLETISFEEQPSASISEAPPAEPLEPWVQEGIGFQEAIQAEIGAIQAQLAEGLGFQESVAGQIGAVQAQLFEGIAFQEALEPKIGAVVVEPADNIGFQESVEAKVGDLKATVQETISFEESVGLGAEVMAVASENVAFQEQIAINLSALSASVDQTIQLTEQIAAQVDALKVSVEETISFSEQPAIGMSVAVAVEETVGVQEQIQASVSALSVQVEEILSFAEDITLGIEGDKFVSVSETVIIQEQVTAILDELKVAVQENLNFGEEASAWIGELFPPVTVSIVESINFTESMIGQVLHYAPTDNYKKEFIIPPGTGTDKEFFVG